MCVILNLVFMKTFNKVFQNILVGTMEQNRLNGWAGKFIKS